ncbi:MAG TPA: prepilin-type N-terminal cleavage/methylation domain-containing protein [Terriglobales bacterium]
MTTHTMRRRKSQRGFSLLEMITVVAILTLVMGVVFKQVINVQQRYRTEETKLDISQESREFLDQMVRDLHQAGYPTARIYAAGPVVAGGAGLASPAANDQRVAAGLVKYAYNDLWFEGDVDGDGVVDVVEYKLNAPGGTCPCSIQRRQTTKIGVDLPLNRIGSSFATELQNVINSGGSGGAQTNGAYGISGTGPGGATNETLYGGLEGPYIFQAFKSDGTAVLPTDIVTNPTELGKIRSIQVTINVLGKQSGSDLQTGRRPAISLTATARITNY